MCGSKWSCKWLLIKETSSNDFRFPSITQSHLFNSLSSSHSFHPQNPNELVPSPSPRIMSPMGFAVHRQARHIASVMDEKSMYGDDWDYYGEDGPPMSYIRPVPIWLCVFLVIGYIIGGAFIFQKWEQWDFLDSAYFCFITLTTIGECYSCFLLFSHELWN